MEYPLIISFYADPPGERWYSESAAKFESACCRFGLNHDIQELQSSDSWLENTRKKASFVLDNIMKHRRDVLWVDIDTILIKPPVYQWNRTADFAAVKFNGVSRLSPPLKIRSTAMWFNFTPHSLQLLKLWKEKCISGRYGDHREISNLLYPFEGVVEYMPDSYAHEREQPDSVMVMGMADPVVVRKTEMKEIANEIIEAREGKRV